MAGPLYFDRTQESSTTTGTGTYTLGGATTGYQAWSVVGNGNTAYYMATDGINWEVGLGTYTLSGTTLARTTILESSNANAAVSWSAGTRTISLVSAAAFYSNAARTDAGQTFTGTQAFSTAIAVSSGGSGAATFAANNVLLGNGTSAFQVVAPSTSGNVLTSNGTTWASTAPAAGGQPIPTNSTWAIGTFAWLVNWSGSNTANGSTIAGSALRTPTSVFGASTGAIGATTSAMTGTWTNVSGVTVNTAGSSQPISAGGVGYFVRTV